MTTELNYVSWGAVGMVYVSLANTPWLRGENMDYPRLLALQVQFRTRIASRDMGTSWTLRSIRRQYSS